MARENFGLSAARTTVVLVRAWIEYVVGRGRSRPRRASGEAFGRARRRGSFDHEPFLDGDLAPVAVNLDLGEVSILEADRDQARSRG